MNLKSLLGISFVMVSIAGCEDDRFIYELPAQPQKIVVNFTGVNDVKWSGSVTLSEGVLKSHLLPQHLNDATVRVFEDGVFIEVLSPVEDPYEITFESFLKSPQPGKNYTIEVVTTEHGTATASYRQPTLIQPVSFQTEVLGPWSEPWVPEGGEDWMLEVTFQDPPGADFYEILVHCDWDTVLVGGGGYGFGTTLGLTSDDPAYVDIEDKFSGSPGFIFNDRLFENSEAKMNFKAGHPFFLDPNTGQVVNRFKKYTLEIRHLSPDYYNYLRTYVLQKNTYGDPYAQPVKVTSNIENGLGLFGGFTRSTTEYKIE